MKLANQAELELAIKDSCPHDWNLSSDLCNMCGISINQFVLMLALKARETHGGMSGWANGTCGSCDDHATGEIDMVLKWSIRHMANTKHKTRVVI